MLNLHLFSPEVQTYISEHLQSDLVALLLKKSPFPEVSMQEIVQQVKGKKVAEKKFPFLEKEGIVFPPNLNLEQSSSQATATYKRNLVFGTSMIDLTCGFGIDAYFLSEKFQQITLVERNPELLDIVRHNWTILGKDATFCNEDLNAFLAQNTEHFNLIYLDPARRDEHKEKVFLLEDLSPDLLAIQEQLSGISDQILVKLSPLIDLSYLISVVKNIAEIHIVAVKNEVKEVLVLMKSQQETKRIQLKCVNLESNDPDFEFYVDELSEAESTFSEPKKFLYIPNNTVLKSGAFKLICKRFRLQKLHENTHLYTAENEIPDFPGRIFPIEKVDAKSLKKGEQYNLISKNYPLKPEAIKKKYGLKDGGKRYLIFTQSKQGKIILKSVEN